MALQTQQIVNTTTVGSQGQAIVTATNDGGYFIAWVDGNAYADPAGTVKGQYFDAGGNMVGAEIDIGTTRVEGNSNQDGPSLAITTLDGGDIAVVWVAEGANAIDGSGAAIANVIVDSTTQTAGAQQVVNTTTAGHQGLPAITATNDGGYFVAWANNALSNPGGTVQGQFFDAGGTTIGTEISIGSARVEGANNSEGATLVTETLDGGDVIVSWVSEARDNDDTDGSGTAIVHSIVDPGTQTAGPETVVNSTTASHQGQPVVVATDDGGYFVTWVGANAFTGGVAGVVQGQYYDANGNTVGGELTISTSRVEGNNGAEGQTLNATQLDNGDIAVAWTNDSADTPSGHGRMIGYTVIDSTTQTVGAEQVANTVVAGDQGQPQVHSTPDGGFFIAWTGNAYNAASAGQVSGQQFDAAGNKVGAEQSISTTAVEGGNGSEGGTLNVEVLAGGRVVISWTADNAAALDGNGTSIAQFVTCFTTGVLIDTPDGPVPVEQLKIGDLVSVQDGAPMPIRWIGSRRIMAEELAQNSKLRPVRVTCDALAPGVPKLDLLVSRQHRILVSSKIVQRMFGVDEILIPAIRLTELPGVFIDSRVNDVEYFHILLDAHQIVTSNGALSETLLLGKGSFEGVGPDALSEIQQIFPGFTEAMALFEPARVVPNGGRQRKVVERHKLNDKACQISRPT